MGISDGTEIRFNLLYFCVVFSGGRSSMNFMVSVGVSFGGSEYNSHCLVLHPVQL